MSDAEALATITGMPPARTEQLLAQYGGLPGLRRAVTSGSLPHISPARRDRLSAAFSLTESTLAEEAAPITSPEDAYRLLAPYIEHAETEQLAVLLLNTKNRVIKMLVLYSGSIDTITVRIAELFRDAVRYNAASIILGHNHPSQDPTPSPEDVAMTRRAVEAGTLLDIPLRDHLVVGGGGYVSLKDRGLGFAP